MASPLLKSVMHVTSNPHAPHVQFPCALPPSAFFDFRELSMKAPHSFAPLPRVEAC
jgi:hypothetical protein